MPKSFFTRSIIITTSISILVTGLVIYYNLKGVVPASIYTVLLVASYAFDRRRRNIIVAAAVNFLMMTLIVVTGTQLNENFHIVRWVASMIGYSSVAALLLYLSRQVSDLRQIKKSEERMELALDGITAGLWDWKIEEGDKRWWSPRYYELLGYEPGEIEANAQTLADMTHPVDFQLAKKTLDKHLQSPRKFEIEQRYKTKGGEYKWFLVHGQTKFNKEGKPVRMIGSIIDIDDKKRSQQLIEQQAALIQIIPHAIIYGDKNLNVNHINETAEELFEIKKEAIIGKRLTEMINYEVVGQTPQQVLHTMRDQNSPWKGEVVFTLHNGKKKNLLASARMIFNKDGEVEGWVGIYTDITSLKIAQERLQLATEGTAAGIWDWPDVSKDEEWWSPRFYQLLGYEEGEIAPALSTFQSLLHPDDVAPTLHLLDEHFKQRRRFEIEYRLRTKSGEYKWFLGSAQAKYNPNGQPERLVGSIIDIDERKRAEKMIADYAELVRMMPDGVIRVSKSRKIVSANENAQRLFEATETQMKGKDFTDFVSMNILGTTRDAVWNNIWANGFWRGEVEVTARSGKQSLLLVNIKATETEGDGEPTWLGIYTDISMLRLNEELNIALHKLEENNKYLEQFAYISSHDIKAPVIALEGLVDLLDKAEGIKDEQRQLLQMIKRTTQQMQRTNQSLNSILRLRKNLTDTSAEGGEPVRLQIIMEDVLATLEPQIKEAGGVLNTDMLEVQHIMFPYMHFKSVMYNLISNAIKYRHPDKELQILVSAHELYQGVYLFNVQDNGLGIDLGRNKDKVFGIFKRFHDHVEGSGVGLHIVKSIIQAYGGNIKIESEPNKGTKISFTFKSMYPLTHNN